MAIISEIYEYLDKIAPAAMKMEHDNVGHLVGSVSSDVKKILVSLDITSDVIAEAIELGARLIVSHHPLFFSLKSVTDADTTGKKIIQMLSGGLAAICMHTNLDAALDGVNDALAIAAGITDGGRKAELLAENGRLPTGQAYSYGRVGHLSEPNTLAEYMQKLKTALKADRLRYHDAGLKVYKIAVVGGSGGDELHNAASSGCDTFVTGEMKYHMFLEAKELGMNLIEGGHFCTENLVTEVLAGKLQAEFPETQVVVSRKHTDTVKFY